jgi:hypothetical protein
MSVDNAVANIRGFSIHTGIKVKMQEAQNQRMKAYKSFKLGSFPLVLTCCVSSIMPPRTRSKQNKASCFRKHVRLVRNMNRIEAQHQLFRNIRYMEEKLSAGSTTQVTVTSPDGLTTELTQRDEVEKAVMAENERKFHQTEGGSQLLSDRFVRDIGKFGNGPSVANILEGTYDHPPEATEATKDFLNACQRPINLVEWPTESVVFRYWNLVKAWKTRK